MDYYQDNIDFLKLCMPKVYDRLVNGNPCVQNFCLEDKDGTFIGDRDGVRCHIESSYAKEKEYAWSFLNVSKETEIIILFGCGFFGQLEYIIKNFKAIRKIIFIEPSRQIFDCFLHREDFVTLFKKAMNVQIIFDVNLEAEVAAHDVTSIVKTSSKFGLVGLVSYKLLFADYYNDFTQTLKRNFMLWNIQFGNNRTNMESWIREIMRNSPVKALPAEKLSASIKGRPVILVGAGPSLAKNMHLLQAASEKAIVIAVGKSVQILNRAGIRPHFNAGLDALNIDYYDNLQFPDVPIIFTNQFSSEILKRYTGAKIHFLSYSDPINAYLYQNAENRSFFIASGTSVINSIHDLVSKLECSCVIFVGQDMCFYDEKLYADGNPYQNSNGFAFKKAYDIYGNAVSTISAYASIKPCIEMTAANYPGVKVINATEGGLGMSCAANVRLSAIIEALPELNISIEKELPELFAGASDTLCSTLACFEKLNVIDAIDETLQVTNEIVQMTDELGKMYKRGAKQAKLEKKINRIHRLNEKLESNDFYHHIIRGYLGEWFDVIEENHSYEHEKIIEKKVLAVMKCYVGKMVEVRQYSNIVKEEYEKVKKNAESSSAEVKCSAMR